jgi:4-amino-4-deoxy-L-arabinose transferase-like glycosyltransferase
MTRSDGVAVPAAPSSDRLLLVGLALLGLAVRLPGVGGDLWIDEVATLIRSVRPPLADIVSTFQSPNNHVLYSVLAHFSIGIFGETSFALRLPALLFGAATIPALYYLARLWLARREALAAALVLAVSYHHAYFAQNARGYTGFLLLSILTTAWLARALETGRRRYWVGFAVATALNVYLLLSALFVCLGQTLALLVATLRGPGSDAAARRRGFIRFCGWMGMAALLTLVLYAPLLVTMFEFFTTAEGSLGWFPSVELLRVILRDALPVRSLPVLLLAGALVAPVVGAGVVSLVRRAPLLGFAFVLPPVLETAVGMGMGVGTYPRRFLLLLPFLILAGVRGAAMVAEWVAARARRPVWSRHLFTAAVATGMAAAALGLTRLYTIPKQDFTGALAYVHARRNTDDVLAAADLADRPAQYYDSSVRSARTPDDLRDVLREDRTVWLIVTMAGDLRRRQPELWSLIERRFELQERFRGLVGDGTVSVWRSAPKG